MDSASDITETPLNNTRNEVINAGFIIPGRPSTPSDGRAQHYARRGDPEHQTIRVFDNGSTITFGSEDHVDEFRPLEAFYEQSLQIQRAAMDLLAAGAVMVGVSGQEDEAESNWDVRSFRSQDTSAFTRPRSNTHLRERDITPNIHSEVVGPRDYFQAGEQGRRPYYSPSIYEDRLRGLNTRPGKGHPGYSTDSRFGVEQRGGPRLSNRQSGNLREDYQHHQTPNQTPNRGQHIYGQRGGMPNLQGSLRRGGRNARGARSMNTAVPQSPYAGGLNVPGPVYYRQESNQATPEFPGYPLHGQQAMAQPQGLGSMQAPLQTANYQGPQRQVSYRHQQYRQQLTYDMSASQVQQPAYVAPQIQQQDRGRIPSGPSILMMASSQHLQQPEVPLRAQSAASFRSTPLRHSSSEPAFVQRQAQAEQADMLNNLFEELDFDMGRGLR